MSLTTPDGIFSNTTGAGFTFDIRTASDEYTIVTTVTDSRGFTRSETHTIIVEACGYPAVTVLSAERCDILGNLTDEGTFIFVNAEATVARAATGNIVYTVALQEVNGASLPTGLPNDILPSTTISGGGLRTEAHGILTGGDGAAGAINIEKSYLVTLTITDGLGQVTTVSITVGSAIYTIHRMAGGKGVAFGAVSTKFGVEVTESWPFYTHGKEIERLILDMAYPVGSVLQTFDAEFNPNEKWNWSLWTKLDGVFLYASDANTEVGETGGVSSNALTFENLPPYDLIGADATGYTDTVISLAQGSVYEFRRRNQSQVNIDNMPPYITVNMWVRAR